MNNIIYLFIYWILLVMPIREPVRYFRWRLDPFDPHSSGRGRGDLRSEGDSVWSHPYIAWSSCDPKPCLHFFCTTRYRILSLWSHSKQKEVARPGQSCRLYYAAESLTSPFINTVTDQYFHLHISVMQESEWEPACLMGHCACTLILCVFTRHKKHSFPQCIPRVTE